MSKENYVYKQQDLEDNESRRKIMILGRSSKARKEEEYGRLLLLLLVEKERERVSRAAAGAYALSYFPFQLTHTLQ